MAACSTADGGIKMENLILCGYTSSGKSTIGRKLAELLNCSYIDTDALIEAACGMTIPAYCSAFGMEAFRELEHEVTKKLAGDITERNAGSSPAGKGEADREERFVISTGGGLLTYERNCLLMKSLGKVVYIKRPFDDCYAALSHHPERPLFRDHSREELEASYTARDRLYSEAANLIVLNDTTPAEAVHRIMRRL